MSVAVAGFLLLGAFEARSESFELQVLQIGREMSDAALRIRQSAAVSEIGFAIARKKVAGPADALDESKVGIAARFVLIKPGAFDMGSPASEEDRDRDEDLYPVTLTNGFEMQATAVTQRQFILALGRNPAYFKSSKDSDGDHAVIDGHKANADHPVEQVSWFDAVEFANAVSAAKGLAPAYVLRVKRRSIDGRIVDADVEVNGPDKNIYKTRGYRLPTEAEREYAARAGAMSAYSFGRKGSGNPDEHSWHWDNSGGRTHAVASQVPNAWGLYDMEGNVLEWVWDWYDDYPKTAVTDPAGPATSPVSVRVLRGGYMNGNILFNVRSAQRYNLAPESGVEFAGFRLVRSRP